jgi:hypothetical protein
MFTVEPKCIIAEREVSLEKFGDGSFGMILEQLTREIRRIQIPVVASQGLPKQERCERNARIPTRSRFIL